MGSHKKSVQKNKKCNKNSEKAILNGETRETALFNRKRSGWNKFSQRKAELLKNYKTPIELIRENNYSGKLLCEGITGEEMAVYIAKQGFPRLLPHIPVFKTNNTIIFPSMPIRVVTDGEDKMFYSNFWDDDWEIIAALLEPNVRLFVTISIEFTTKGELNKIPRRGGHTNNQLDTLPNHPDFPNHAVGVSIYRNQFKLYDCNSNKDFINDDYTKRIHALGEKFIFKYLMEKLNRNICRNFENEKRMVFSVVPTKGLSEFWDGCCIYLIFLMECFHTKRASLDFHNLWSQWIFYDMVSHYIGTFCNKDDYDLMFPKWPILKYRPTYKYEEIVQKSLKLKAFTPKMFVEGLNKIDAIYEDVPYTHRLNMKFL